MRRLNQRDVTPDVDFLKRFDCFLTVSEYAYLATMGVPTERKLTGMVKQMFIAHGAPKYCDYVSNLLALFSIRDATPATRLLPIIVNPLARLTRGYNGENQYVGRCLQPVVIDFSVTLTTPGQSVNTTRSTDVVRIMLFQWKQSIAVSATNTDFVTSPTVDQVLLGLNATDEPTNVDPNSYITAPKSIDYQNQIKVLFNHYYVLNGLDQLPGTKQTVVNQTLFEPYCDPVLFDDAPVGDSVQRPSHNALLLLVQNLRFANRPSGDTIVGMRIGYVNR